MPPATVAPWLPVLCVYVSPEPEPIEGPPMPGAPVATAPEIDPTPVGPS